MGRKPMPRLKWDTERANTIQNEVLWHYELPKDRSQKELIDLIKYEFSASGFICSSFDPDDYNESEFIPYGLFIRKNDSFFMKLCGLRQKIHISSVMNSSNRQVHLKPTNFYQDKIIAVILGFIIPILWITAGVGFFQQQDLTERIKKIIRNYLEEINEEDSDNENLVDLDTSDIDELSAAFVDLGEPESVGEDGIPVSFNNNKNNGMKK